MTAIGRNDFASASPCGTLSELPDDILHQIAKHLQKPTLRGGYQVDRYDLRGILLDCCRKHPRRQMATNLAPQGTNGSPDILRFASTDKQIRSVIFSPWLLRSIMVVLCGTQLQELKDLPRELRDNVRSLMILSTSALHVGEIHRVKHSDFLRLFENLQNIEICWQPISDGDSRMAGMQEAVADNSLRDKDPVRDTACDLPNVPALSLKIPSTQYIHPPSATAMSQFSLLFLQLKLSGLRRIDLEFTTFESAVDCLEHLRGAPNISFPNLTTIGLSCKMPIQPSGMFFNVHTRIERILQALGGRYALKDISIHLLLELRQYSDRSPVWLHSPADPASFDEVRPELLPTPASCASILSIATANHPKLHSLDVDIDLNLVTFVRQDNVFDFWNLKQTDTVDGIADNVEVKHSLHRFDDSSVDFVGLSISWEDIERAFHLEWSEWEANQVRLRNPHRWRLEPL